MKIYTLNPLPQGSTTAFVDVLVRLPSPARMVALVGSPSSDSHLYLSQMPQSKVVASPLAVTGIEGWVPLQGAIRNFPVLVFDDPIDRFYLSGDSGASGLNANFSLLIADGIMSLEAVAGITPVSIASTVPVSIAGTVEVVEQGAGKSNGNQVAVGNATTVIAAARATRRGVMITQLANGTDIYLGIGTAATLAAGDLLPGVKGASVVFPTTLAINGITATGTANVSFVELYD